jgi:hypothetical protein
MAGVLHLSQSLGQILGQTSRVLTVSTAKSGAVGLPALISNIPYLTSLPAIADAK